MLESMRKHSAGILAKILFGLLMVSFGIWGIGDMVNIGGGDDAVATVGDAEISGRAFDDEFSRELRRMQGQLGDAVTRDMARAAGLDRQVLQSMVSRTLFGQGARDLGVTVPDAKVVAAVHAESAFKGADGTFDANRFNDVMRTSGLGENQYLNLVRVDLTNTQYMGSLRAGLTVPKTLAKVLYAYTAETRTAETLLVKDDAVPAPAAATDAQLADYHRSHAERYTAPEYRALTALVLRAADVAKETAVAEADIQAAYDERIDEFKSPETRTLRQMVLASEDDAKKAAALIAEGVSFDDVAKHVAGMDADALALGTVDKTKLLPELADAAFAAASGTVTPPVKSPLGWHLIEVEAVVPAATKTLADVRDQLRDAIAADRAVDGLYALVNQVEDELGGGATLEETAQALNLSPLVVRAVDPAGLDLRGETIAALPTQPQFLETAFTTEEGTDSLMIDAGGDVYFVLRVDAVTPPALRPLADVRDRVAADFLADARKTAAEDTAKALLEKVKGGAALADLGAPMGLTPTQTAPFVRGGGDLPAPLAAELFSAKVGDAGMARGADGYVIARLTGVEKADPAAAGDKVAALAGSLARPMESDLLAQLAEGLRAAHPVAFDQAALARRFAGDEN